MKTTTIDRLEIIKGLYKPVAQPHAETFQECFDAFERYTTDTKIEPRYLVDGKERMHVGPYCVWRDHYRSFAVRCADWVLSRIRERTILVDNDRMHFELVDHDNGYTLVVASHGQIIGSLYLAYIRTDSIPVLEEERSACHEHS